MAVVSAADLRLRMLPASQAATNEMLRVAGKMEPKKAQNLKVLERCLELLTELPEQLEKDGSNPECDGF